MMENAADAVASPAALHDRRSLTDAATQQEDDSAVYLRATWVFATLRRPHWRLATCSLRGVLAFLAFATSPLFASVKAPGFFPVYSDLFGIFLTRLSAWKLLLHGVLAGILVLWIRLVVYRLWFEDQWNWRRQYKHAQLTFRRLSRVSSAWRLKELMESQRQGNHHQTHGLDETIQLRISKTSSTTGDSASLLTRVHTKPRAQGSWTLVAALLPVVWWGLAWLLRRVVVDTDYDDLLFGQDVQRPQWRVQLAVYNTVMSLNTVSWILAFDAWLQDLKAPRANGVLRILFNWLLLALLAVTVLYVGCFTQLLSQFLEASNRNASHFPNMLLTLTSESWRCMLSGVVVVLDLVWLVQDPQFPGFATHVGAKIFGFHRDFVAIPLGFRGIQIYATSKWIQAFVVLGLLLPIDLCSFFQDFNYTPASYGQFVDESTGFRVFPLALNTTAIASDTPEGIEMLLKEGSIGRYFQEQSVQAVAMLDRVPALVCVVMMAGLCVWLQQRERWRLRYTAFLGQPTRADQSKMKHNLNAALPAATRTALKDQLRLNNLYHVRSQYDLLGSSLAAVSVGIVILQVRSIWRSQSATSSSSTQETAGETYGVLLSAVSLLMVYQLYHRYALKYEILVLRKQIPPTSTRWWRGTSKSLLLYPFLCELLLSGICLPPFVHGQLWFDEDRYLVSPDQATIKNCPARMLSSGPRSCALQYAYPAEVLNLVVFLRLYWLVRLLRNVLFQKLFADHAALLVAAGMGRSSILPREISSLKWSFRMCLSLIPGRVIFGIFLLLWMGTAAALSILERPFPSLLDSEDHSLWLTIVTISAVGYGDAYPLTVFGRLAIVVGAVLGGAIVVSLMTSIFLDALKGSKEEHRFVQQLELLTYEKKLQHLGASLIATAWTSYQQRRGRGVVATTSPQAQARDDVFQKANEFNITRKMHKPKETHESIEQLRIRSIAKWRTQGVREWVQRTSQERRAAVDSLERDVSVLEKTLAPLLAL